MEINVNDKFILHSKDGHDYRIEVVNKNEFREPDMKYALDIYDENGNCNDDVFFVGDEFFENDFIERKDW